MEDHALTNRLIVRLSVLLLLLGFWALSASAQSADFDQCANGANASPQPCTGSAWQNGPITPSNAHYIEGWSVPMRIVFSSLSVGTSYSVTLKYYYTRSGKYAYDYITNYDRTESVGNNPCSDVAGCSLASEQIASIPLDPQVAAGFDGMLNTLDDIAQIPGNFSIIGGSVTNVSGYTLTGSTLQDSDKSLVVTFTANQANAVLAFGAHIATRNDWGQTAMSISGSPYHFLLVDFAGSPALQDRAMSNTTVIPGGTITIIKDAQPDSLLPFGYSATGQAASTFTLVDNGIVGPDRKTFDGLGLFGAGNAVTVTETSAVNFTLSAINCISDARGGNGMNNNTLDLPNHNVSIVLEQGEKVTCTFVSLAPTAAPVMVSGRAISSFGYGIPNVRIALFQEDGSIGSAITNSFGYFAFIDVPAGETFVIAASSKRYQFANPVRVITTVEDVTDIIFVTQPE